MRNIIFKIWFVRFVPKNDWTLLSNHCLETLSGSYPHIWKIWSMFFLFLAEWKSWMMASETLKFPCTSGFMIRRRRELMADLLRRISPTFGLGAFLSSTSGTALRSKWARSSASLWTSSSSNGEPGSSGSWSIPSPSLDKSITLRDAFVDEWSAASKSNGLLKPLPGGTVGWELRHGVASGVGVSRAVSAKRSFSLGEWECPKHWGNRLSHHVMHSGDWRFSELMDKVSLQTVWLCTCYSQRTGYFIVAGVCTVTNDQLEGCRSCLRSKESRSLSLLSFGAGASASTPEAPPWSERPACKAGSCACRACMHTRW